MMNRTPIDTDRLARELLALSSGNDPDASTLAIVARQLDAVRDVLRLDSEYAPSDVALRRAEAVFQKAPAMAAPSRVERLRAILTFDSRSALPAPGFRGRTNATMMRYESGDILVDLEVRPSMSSKPDLFSITGQIDWTPEKVRGVELWTNEGVLILEETDVDAGSFTLTVEAGSYDLVAWIGSTELTVPGVVVG